MMRIWERGASRIEQTGAAGVLAARRPWSQLCLPSCAASLRPGGSFGFRVQGLGFRVEGLKDWAEAGFGHGRIRASVGPIGATPAVARLSAAA